MQEKEATIWCLTGGNTIENAQLLTLARALGKPFIEKPIKAHRWELLVHLGHGATLAGIDQAASSPLTAPWPALVVTASRCCEPVAQWIKRQSGGRTRLVHVGCPWAPLQNWDLVITTPDYSLPYSTHLLRLSLPFHTPGPEPDDIIEAPRQLPFAHLPRPWIALLPDRDTGPFVLTEENATVLGDLADKLAAATGGSLLYCDHPELSWNTADAIISQLRGDNFIHHDDGESGLFRDILNHADAVITSGTTPVRLAEAAAGDRPLLLVDYGNTYQPNRAKKPWWTQARNFRPGILLYHLQQQCLPQRLQREPGKLHRNLLASGRARRLQAETLADAVRYVTIGRDASTTAQQNTIAAKELASVAAAVMNLLRD